MLWIKAVEGNFFLHIFGEFHHFFLIIFHDLNERNNNDTFILTKRVFLFDYMTWKSCIIIWDFYLELFLCAPEQLRKKL